jgi:hypothetical protein
LTAAALTTPKNLPYLGLIGLFTLTPDYEIEVNEKGNAIHIFDPSFSINCF